MSVGGRIRFLGSYLTLNRRYYASGHRYFYLHAWPPSRTSSAVSELLQSPLCISTAVKNFPFSSPIILLSTLSPSSVSWVEDHNRKRLGSLELVIVPIIELSFQISVLSSELLKFQTKFQLWIQVIDRLET